MKSVGSGWSRQTCKPHICDARLRRSRVGTNKSSKTSAPRTAAPTRVYQTGAGNSAIPWCSKVLEKQLTPTGRLGVAVCDARPRVPDRRHQRNVINDGIVISGAGDNAIPRCSKVPRKAINATGRVSLPLSFSPIKSSKTIGERVTRRRTRRRLAPTVRSSRPHRL